jgi:predicted nucleic acid-binding protein
VKRFFDSNIFVYAFSSDSRNAQALEILEGGGVISAQVLNEFTNVMRRKEKRDWPDIEAAIVAIRVIFHEIIPLTEATHAKASALAKAHNLNFYDALIVASAIETNCDELITEDMQHGRRIGSLQILNPFNP